MARKARQRLREGEDPLEDAQGRAARASADRRRAPAHSSCAPTTTSSFTRTSGATTDWRKQFGQSLRDYVLPKIGHLPVAEIDRDQVLRCVEPIWKTIPPTARRVLGRIEDVLSYATARSYREGLNPARWDGHMEQRAAQAEWTATSTTTRFRTSRCRSSCPACAPSTA